MSARSSKWQRIASVGSVFTAAVASVCCIGPLLFVLLGVGGAGFLAQFAPFRPFFILLTVGLLGIAHYLTYRKKGRHCRPGEACASPQWQRANKIVLWIATALATLFLLVPYLASILF